MRETVPMGFTGETIPRGSHMCYIYTGEEERKRIISQFLASGVRNGEKVSYFMDVNTADELEQWRATLGMDSLFEGHQRRVSFAPTTEVYCPTGTFIPEEMLDRLSDFYTESIREGYTGARATGEMTWAARGVPGSLRLMEYEARINAALRNYPVTALCQYDAQCFTSSMLRDVLAVHPMIILHGQILKNPYYVPSWWLLKRCSRPTEER